MSFPSLYVAVLCTANTSSYNSLPGVLTYSKARGARTFPGGCRLVAHPPCRPWSAFTSHQAKPEPGEKELGLWCVEQVRREGGVLEHPAHSRLWEAAGIGPVGKPGGREWSIEVCQAWWGYPMIKRTWLLLVGIEPGDVHLPLVLHPEGLDRRRQQLMSRRQRSEAVPAFAEWLVSLARRARRPTAQVDYLGLPLRS